MKKYIHQLFAVSVLTLLGINANAQTQKKYQVQHPSGIVNIIDIDDIIIEAYDGTDVIVRSEVEEDKRAKRAEGLKLLNGSGVDDNTGFGISVLKEGDEVNILKVGNQCSCKDVSIQIPKNVVINISHGNYNAKSIKIKDVTSELLITTNYHDVYLENVTGPMSVKTIYGKIEGTFEALSQKGSVSVYSVYDIVDLTLPATAKANTVLSAPYGNIYTNFDVNVNATKKKSNVCGIGQTVRGDINGGGVEFSVKSSYEDVYLRRKI